MYSHTQKSGLMIFTSMFLLAGGAALSWFSGRDALFYPPAGVALFIYFGFRELAVEVDEVSVRLSFGAGWFKKSFPLSDIISARAVKNSWMCGWGIRYIGKGWLYNISGLDAVELELGNGRIVRIGTDEPLLLEAEIKRRIAHRP